MPEVQAHAERMTEALAGFRPLTFTALKTYAPAPEVAIDAPLAYVGQRGKHLLLDFGVATFVVHLMQGGRLRPDEKKAAKPRGGVARWTFEDDRALLLTEAGTERKAGVWVVEGDPEVQAPLDHLGPEADAVGPEALLEILHATNSRIHGVLRDQRQIAGIGRMLANEICYAAELSPFANTAKLTDDEVDRLHRAIGEVVAAALEHERTLDDIGRSADRPSKVHNRGGQPCLDCDDTIRTVEYRAYTVAYCPTRQTGGKVLADNTTSKFLR